MAQQTETIPALQNGVKPSHSKGKRTRKYRSVGGTSGGDLKDKTATYKVDTQGCEWGQLSTFSAFVIDPDDILIKVKDSCSSYICLKTGSHEIDIASGRVYRVYI
jgi:hypothetical protein